jgi:hypothetical protein
MFSRLDEEYSQLEPEAEKEFNQDPPRGDEPL